MPVDGYHFHFAAIKWSRQMFPSEPRCVLVATHPLSGTSHSNGCHVWNSCRYEQGRWGQRVHQCCKLHHDPKCSLHSPRLFVCLCVCFWCHPQEAPMSRGKRTVEESKTCCLLHLHVDHLYYKKFKSLEAVVAQVTMWSLSLLEYDWCYLCRLCEVLEFSVRKSKQPTCHCDQNTFCLFNFYCNTLGAGSSIFVIFFK